MAIVFNAGNNALNQIYDLEIDRVNKGRRPLPSGRLTIAQAWALHRDHVCARRSCWRGSWRPAAATSASGSSSSRSSRPTSTRCRRSERSSCGIWANITIAVPRGVLLKVAGWSAVKTVIGVEPWFIGGIFGLFLLGASTTKDFADMEGDRRGGCRTLPIQYGVRARRVDDLAVVRRCRFSSSTSARPPASSPATRSCSTLLGAVMTAYGLYVCYLMLKRPEDLAVEENHVSWAHMYRMMFVAQIGFAAGVLALEGRHGEGGSTENGRHGDDGRHGEERGQRRI